MTTKAMSSRERLLTVLRGGEPDRIPWSPCVSPYYMMGHPKHKQMTHLDYYLEMGADALLRMVPLGLSVWENPPEVETLVETDGNATITQLRTPVGTLTTEQVVLPTSPWIPFFRKRMVNSLEDLKILTWIQERQVWNPKADYEEFEHMVRLVGDRGIVTASMTSSPFQYLLEMAAGVEVFYDLLMTATAEVEYFMGVLLKQNLRIHELAAESPAEVFIGYENTGTSNCSPDYYARYAKPQLDAYADIIHGAGKIYFNHDCGLLTGLEEHIRTGHQDGRIDVAREPTGNFDYRRRLDLVGDKVIIGGIDATAFTTLNPEQMQDHVRQFFKDVAPGRYFGLGSGDAIPYGTPPEVLSAVGVVVKKEGIYPLGM